jgi:hypothetical protein
MIRKFMLIGTVLTVAASVVSPAFAGASDYVFDPINIQIKKGDDAKILVRLIHKPTGKPVSDAIIVKTRIDMAPEGMADMDSPITALASPEPGVYAFQSDLGMVGRWLFSIAAKIQGEPETVVSKITFIVTK